jgi:ribosome-binding protein aMBF1 (putative translation factor)
MKQKTGIRTYSDARAILDRMTGDNAEPRRMTEEAGVNAAVAQVIYETRSKAGLSQAELA